MNNPTNVDPVVEAFENWSGWQSIDKVGEGPMLQCFRAGWQAGVELYEHANGRKKTGILDQSIDELELSVRAYNCLMDAHLETVGDVVSKSENDLLKMRKFGKKSLREVKEILSNMGLTLGGIPIKAPADHVNGQGEVNGKA